MNDDDSEKSHFWFALYLFVRVIRVLFLFFFALDFVNKKTIKCFFMKLNKY